MSMFGILDLTADVIEKFEVKVSEFEFEGEGVKVHRFNRMHEFTPNKVVGYRFVVEMDNKAVAAITFDRFGKVGYKETEEEYRRRGIQNNLWLLAAVELLKEGIKITHSDVLTDLGRVSIRANRRCPIEALRLSKVVFEKVN